MNTILAYMTKSKNVKWHLLRNKFYFMGTKFRHLMTMDMFVDTWICGFEIIQNIYHFKPF